MKRYLLHSLTNQQLILFQKGISRHLQIKWGRPLPDPSGNIIMTSMARTKPPSEITSIGQRNAAQMSTNANDHEPLGILDPDSIFLRIPKGVQINTVGQLDILFGSPTYEDGLATPFYGYGRPRLDAGEIDLKGSKGKNIFTCRHGKDEFEDKEPEEGGVHEAASS